MLSKEQVGYFIEKVTMLSKPYEEQFGELHVLGDYLTEDLANDWMFEEAENLKELYKCGDVSQRVVELYCEIDRNFSDASLHGKAYEDIIWTLQGLRDHPFWAKQRALAEELLAELMKIRSLCP